MIRIYFILYLKTKLIIKYLIKMEKILISIYDFYYLLEAEYVEDFISTELYDFSDYRTLVLLYTIAMLYDKYEN